MELFRTDRRVRIWLQTVSHRQLLLRAVESSEPTRLDLLFKAVERQCIRSAYDGLVVRRPRADEDFPPDAFVLESGDIRDHVCAGSFRWQEDEQTDLGPDSMVTNMMPLPFEPTWNTGERPHGWEPTGPVIPLGGLIDALTNEIAEPPSGFRHVHVVVVKIDDGVRDITRPVAVYLTREEAEAAIRTEVEAKAALLARAEAHDARIQDTLVAKTLADTTIRRWIVPVPIRL
ncbi:hypothetical protein [Kutzneria buriramensis]|nr:hypothetical protein [Kutzneria buriramensis]